MQAEIQVPTPNFPAGRLSPAAAKLLVSWLFGGQGATNQEEATNAGISRAAYYRAVHQLDEWLPQWRGLRESQGVSDSLSESQEVSPVRLLGSQGVSEGLRESQGVSPVRQQAMKADLLDGSGEWNRGNDPCNVRRREQVKVLQDAWLTLFPGKPPLLPANAKSFLSSCDNSCEDVLDLLEQAAARSIEYPLAWLRKVLESRQTTAAPMGPGGLQEPTSEYLHRQAWMRNIPDPEANQWEV
jgi:hypothetical protein